MIIGAEQLLIAFAVCLVVLGAIAVGLLLTYRVKVGGLRDQIATAQYVFAYDDALMWLGVTGKERKVLREELASNIEAAAIDTSVASALSRLGHPKELAREVAAGPSRPTWVLGTIVGVSVWLAYHFAIFAALDVLSGSAEGDPSAHLESRSALLPGAHFSLATDASGGLDEVTLQLGPVSLLAPLIAFLVFSKPWRLVTSRRRTTVEA